MTRVLSVTSVRISLQKSNPPTMLVEATGNVATSGWKNVDLVSIEGELSPDGILDLELAGTPPPRDAVVLPVIRDVTGDFVITTDADRIVGVIVHARTNSMTAMLGAAGGQAGQAGGMVESTGLAASRNFPGLPEPFPNLPPLKSMTVGEEGPIWKTWLRGEEGPTTTWEVGEEGSTLAIGEEGPVKTWRVGEEGTFTLGETPPAHVIVENKPWQLDNPLVPPDRPFPDPGPLVNPFGQR